MSDEAADSPPRQRSEPAGLVRMTEQPAPLPMRLTDAADAYFVARSPRKDSAHTTAAYRRDLRLLAAIIAAHLDVEVAELGVDALTVPVLRTAFAEFANAHAKASIARAWSVWNSFCTFLVTDGILAGNPMSGVTRPRTAKRTPKPLRGDDTPERLLTALADGARQARDPWPERDLAVIVTLLVTGIRSSELLDLTVGDIAGPPGERRLLVTGKGDKQRNVPIEPSLEAVIEAYQTSRLQRFPTRGGRLPSRAPLFTGRDGARMTRSALQHLVRSCYRWAGVYDRVERGTLVHALRHTFATRLGENGATAIEIMELLGHGNLATSQGYIQASTREVRAAAGSNPTYQTVRDIARRR